MINGIQEVVVWFLGFLFSIGVKLFTHFVNLLISATNILPSISPLPSYLGRLIELVQPYINYLITLTHFKLTFIP